MAFCPIEACSSFLWRCQLTRLYWVFFLINTLPILGRYPCKLQMPDAVLLCTPYSRYHIIIFFILPLKYLVLVAINTFIMCYWRYCKKIKLFDMLVYSDSRRLLKFSKVILIHPLQRVPLFTLDEKPVFPGWREREWEIQSVHNSSDEAITVSVHHDPDNNSACCAVWNIMDKVRTRVEKDWP